MKKPIILLTMLTLMTLLAGCGGSQPEVAAPLPEPYLVEKKTLLYCANKNNVD